MGGVFGVMMEEERIPVKQRQTAGGHSLFRQSVKRPLVSRFGFCCHKLPTLYGFPGQEGRKMMKVWHTPYAFHLGVVGWDVCPAVRRCWSAERFFIMVW